jgi:hypothetical protein
MTTPNTAPDNPEYLFINLTPAQVFHGLDETTFDREIVRTDIGQGLLRISALDEAGGLLGIELDHNRYYGVRQYSPGATHYANSSVLVQPAGSDWGKFAGLNTFNPSSGEVEPLRFPQPQLGDITAARVIGAKLLDAATAERLDELARKDFRAARQEGLSLSHGTAGTLGWISTAMVTEYAQTLRRPQDAVSRLLSANIEI